MRRIALVSSGDWLFFCPPGVWIADQKNAAQSTRDYRPCAHGLVAGRAARISGRRLEDGSTRCCHGRSRHRPLWRSTAVAAAAAAAVVVVVVVVVAAAGVHRLLSGVLLSSIMTTSEQG